MHKCENKFSTLLVTLSLQVNKVMTQDMAKVYNATFKEYSSNKIK